MDSKVKSAVNELADLFGTTPKGTTVYFNEYNYTPIPQPVTEAVKAIMNDYSELKYRIGLYSVTVLDTDKKKIANALNRKPIESKTAMGNLHDEFVTGKITEAELKDTLTKKHGYGKRKAAELIDKWRSSVIKSELSQSVYEKLWSEGYDDYSKGFNNSHRYDNDLESRNAYMTGYNKSKDNFEELGGKPGRYLGDTEMDNVLSSRKSIKSSLSDYFPVSGSQAEELEDKISQFNNKSDIRTTLEDYFHIYDDYAEMSVEDFDSALDEYFNEIDEDDFLTDEIDDVSMDEYGGDEYSESLE